LLLLLFLDLLYSILIFQTLGWHLFECLRGAMKHFFTLQLHNQASVIHHAYSI